MIAVKFLIVLSLINRTSIELVQFNGFLLVVKETICVLRPSAHLQQFSGWHSSWVLHEDFTIYFTWDIQPMFMFFYPYTVFYVWLSQKNNFGPRSILSDLFLANLS